jgi:hypothetical protein
MGRILSKQPNKYCDEYYPAYFTDDPVACSEAKADFYTVNAKEVESKPEQ